MMVVNWNTVLMFVVSVRLWFPCVMFKKLEL